MKIENTKAQMRKGVLEYCILSILKDGEAYTSDILDTLKEAKLKNAGLLSYRWEESTGGPPRKYYALTKTGTLFLTELNTTWSTLLKAVNRVTSEKTKK